MSQPTMIASRKLGEQMTFIRTAEDTNGALLEMTVRYHAATSWNGVPYHMHPNQDEHFEILEGSLTVDIAGTRRIYTTGEAFDVPRGAEHAMRNLGTVPAQVRWQVRPALQTQQFFETTFGLADQGKLYHPLQFAVIARAYTNVFRLTRLPLIARLLLPVFALLGHALGYRPYNQQFRATAVVSPEAAQ